MRIKLNNLNGSCYLDTYNEWIVFSEYIINTDIKELILIK
jgi:hypothetical protein